MDFDQLQIKSELNEMRKRCERLERRLRRLTWSLLAVAGLAAVGAGAVAKLMPMTQPAVLTTRRLVVRDGQRVIAELGGDARAGSASLALYGLSGSAKLLVVDENTSLVLDHRGQRRVQQSP